MQSATPIESCWRSLGVVATSYADLANGTIDEAGCLVCPLARLEYDVETGRMVRGPQGSSPRSQASAPSTRPDRGAPARARPGRRTRRHPLRPVAHFGEPSAPFWRTSQTRSRCQCSRIVQWCHPPEARDSSRSTDPSGRICSAFHRYWVEPYVAAADVYAQAPHVGRVDSPEQLLTPVDTGSPTSGIPNNHRTLSPNTTYFVLGQGEDTNHKSPTFVPVGPVLIRSPVAVRNG